MSSETTTAADNAVYEDDPSGYTIVNMGPQHPSTHGVLRLILTLDGERVVRSEPDIGYLHTGIEKTAEVKTYQQALTLTDRMDYLAPLSNNLGYSLAVEKLLGIQVPERVSHIRVLLAELQRVASHMVWLGTSGLDAGAMSMFLYCFQEREIILDLFEAVSGVRMMTSYIQPGGLMADLNPGFLEAADKVLTELEGKVDMYYGLLEKNPIWMERTKGIGILTPDMAQDYCITGPVARASGVDWDLRRDRPYTAYDDYEFNVPIRTEGDCYARYIVRMEEIEESLKICRQALGKITPPGIGVPYRTDDRKIVPPPKYEIQYSMESLIHHFKLFTEGFTPPPGDVYQTVESPRGEVGFHMVSDGSNKPYRMRVRTPSFTNVQLIPELIQDLLLADVVVILASIDFVLGDCDR
ncbi:MAG: NADH-quinone oxidoreductase subunit D [Candidatus Eremiobacteraeota bacterium]|nr:NADH-quinone oxidoreductase subunit D [Candidatus Eremiobacteraeota bacterium]